jgi:ATP-binding cassette, subfamily B, bacterial
MAEQAEQVTSDIISSGAAPSSRQRHYREANLEKSQWGRVQMLIGDRMGLVVIVMAVSIASAMCEAGLLAVSAQAAAALVNNVHTVHRSIGPFTIDTTVRNVLYVGIGLAVLRLFLQIPSSLVPAVIAGDVQAAMRRNLVRAYMHGGWELQSQDREGHFQELMTNQIMQASQGAMQSTNLMSSLFTFIILVISAFALNTIAAVAVFTAAVVLFIILRPARNLATSLSKRLSAAQLEYAGSVGEANRVAEETNVFGTAEPQIERVDSFVRTARRLFLRAQVLNRLVPNVYQNMIYFILVFGLLAADLANVKGFSSLGAVVLLLVRAGTYGQNVQSAQVSLRQSLPYVERLQNASEAYERSTPRRGDHPLKEIETIAFQDVEYFYTAERPVLHGVSWSVKGGETVGVIGPSGAGKSTMVQILLRLREPRSGQYLVNGADAFDIEFGDWHERVAYVPQAPKLLHATVADNVRFFRDFDDAAVERACRLARIHDEIMQWPKGYQTIVGPRADAVSGGQQQRICLARALVSNPSLLVLDEPTSALDPRSEALIQESLESMRSELTLFIIAHRMSTLTICDRVMVVLDGTINAFDTLSELTAGNDYYRFASGIAAGLASGTSRLSEREPEPEIDPEDVPVDVATGERPPT